MRLTLINQFYNPDISPTARLVTSLAEHRARAGDEVTVVASHGGYVERGTAGDVSSNPRVRRIWTPQFGKSTKIRRLIDWATFYLLAFWRVITLPSQDVIISLTTPPYIVCAAVFHKLLHRHTRVILWNMDVYPDVLEATELIRKGGFASDVLRSINRLLFRKLDTLISLDAAMAKLLMSQYAPSDGSLRSIVIPNWESADEFFNPSAPHTNSAGEASKFTVLYMGNAGFGHEFSTFLDAAQMLRDQPIVFRFVGGGVRRAYIADEQKKRGLGNIVFQNYVPEEEKQSMLATGDCALITLADFALGIMSPSKLHANLAMGVPILYIGPAGSNVDDAIRQFDCGKSFRNGDATGIVAFLNELRSDAALRSALRLNARRAFEQAYCDSKTLPQFDAVLSEQVSCNDQPSRKNSSPAGA